MIKVNYKTTHPIFLDEDDDGKPIMSYIDQFVEPKNMEQGLYLYELGESLENANATYSVKLNEGSMLIINNYFWLHGSCLLYTSPSPRDATLSRMPSSA